MVKFTARGWSALSAVFLCFIIGASAFVWATTPTTVVDPTYVSGPLANYDQYQLGGVNVTSTLAYPEQPYSYTVWVSGGVYYAKDGATGAVTSGADAATLINAKLILLTAGRTWHETIVIKGAISLTAPIEVPSYTTIIIDGTLSLTAGTVVMENVNYGVSNDVEITVNGAAITCNNIASSVPMQWNVTKLRLEDLHIHDFKGEGIKINGGNDQYLNKIVMDNPVGDQPTAGISLVETGAIWITDCDVMHSGHGLYISPSASQTVSWGFLSQCAFDSGSQNGIYMGPTGTIKGLTFTDCWVGSNHAQGVDIEDGIGIRFIGLRSVSNDGNGAFVASNWGVTFDHCDFISNDVDNTGDNGINVWGNRNNIVIQGCTIGNQWAIGGYQRYGILINGGTGDNITISENDLTDNLSGGMWNGATGINNKIMNNLGYVTESSGTATILNTQTSIVVNHGCSYTPSAKDVSVTITGLSTNDTGSCYVDTFTSTQMTIHCLRDPGASGLPLAWSVRRTP